MYFTMNRFDVPLSQCEAFEARWLNRDSKLRAHAGFVEFNLLRGGDRDGERLYISHTVWETEAHFRAWVKSLDFKGAHAPRPAAEGPRMISRNQFEELQSLQRITAGGAE